MKFPLLKIRLRVIHKKSKKEKERKGRERESCRERDSTFDRTGDFRLTKKKSSSSRQGLRIETRVGKFRQTPRGKGFFFYLV